MQPQQHGPTILISGGGVDLGDAFKHHIRQSIERTSGKFFNRLVRATVQFAREGALYKCSITMHVGALDPFVSTSTHKEARTCFTQALSSINSQLQRNKAALREDKGQRLDKNLRDDGESPLVIVSETRMSRRMADTFDEAAE